MTVKALEVLLNGKKLYTVGIKDWRALSANVHGHRQTGEDVARLRAMTDQAIPGLGPEGYEFLHLTAWVGVPDPDRPGSSSGQNYENHNLTVGDEVTIREIETDRPDEPMPPHPAGPRAILKGPSSDADGGP